MILQYENFIRQRITEMRMKKNISEYQMSYDLGMNRTYIQSISSGRALPSMAKFLEICEYFKITPSEFFDDGKVNPTLIRRVADDLSSLKEEDAYLIMELVNRLKK